MWSIAISLLKEDYARYCDHRWSLLNVIRDKRSIPGLDYMFWFRLANAFKESGICHRFCIAKLTCKGIKYGFDIPFDTKIGGGFCIKHFGLLIINHQCVIGKNFTVVPGTIIGKSKGKVPIIGNNVHAGANVSIVGGVTIGDNAGIGAGSVVVHSVDGNTVVAGNPAKPLYIRG